MPLYVYRCEFLDRRKKVEIHRLNTRLHLLMSCGEGQAVVICKEAQVLLEIL